MLVLFIARFTHHKQPLKAVEGFYKALQKIPDLRLLMVGEGDAKAETIQRVHELGIEKQVYFQDFRLDVPDMLAASDIFVLPSLWEGMPIGLLEAMAMGKAVVASNVDGNSEVINHMKNGILVDIENIEEKLGNALIMLSLDTSLKSGLEQEAIRTIDQQYSAAVMTRRTEEIYLKLVGRKTENKIHQFAYGI
jgi:glycosyltransferase involved in cell wall biosynthesis